MIPLVIIVVQHFPPGTGIMTNGQTTVPSIIKEVGGTNIATILT